MLKPRQQTHRLARAEGGWAIFTQPSELVGVCLRVLPRKRCKRAKKVVFLQPDAPVCIEMSPPRNQPSNGHTCTMQTCRGQQARLGSTPLLLMFLRTNPPRARSVAVATTQSSSSSDRPPSAGEEGREGLILFSISSHPSIGHENERVSPSFRDWIGGQLSHTS